MATIAVDTYLDDGTARTAGEAWTINDGAQLTIRTDTRWHAGSPVSMTGSLGSITVNDGEVYIDGTQVKWLEFDNGATGQLVPAVGSILLDSAEGSGTVLGVWPSLTSAPLRPGVDFMPSTGWFKLREVTSSYIDGMDLDTAGPVLGRCVGTEKTGWIEVVARSTATMIIPRLGKFKTRGDWFNLGLATNSVAQELQIPTNGGGNETLVPGVWVETAVGGGTYEFWPALCEMSQTATYAWTGSLVTVTLTAHGYNAGAFVYLLFTSGTGVSGTYAIVSVPTTGTFAVDTGVGSGTGGNVTIVSAAKNGWEYNHLGQPEDGSDARQNFVLGKLNGKIQFGETRTWAGNYANIAAVSTPYTVGTHSCTYTWAGDIVTVTYATGHSLKTGHQVYADFTTGGATAYDGLYTITVLDQYTYTFALAGSGTAGNVTIRWGLSFTLAGHVLGIGDTVYLNVTSGSATSGAYTVFGVLSTSVYYVAHAPSAGTSPGNADVHVKYTIQMPGVCLFGIGNRVSLNFSGASTDGDYTVIYPAAPVQQASTYTWVANVVTVTFTSHGRKVGDWVYLHFTSGGATAHGVYQIATVPGTGSYTVALTGSGTAGNVIANHASFDIIANNGAAGDSGTVTITQSIGNLPLKDANVRIPNILLRECASGTDATNFVNTTLANRPDFTTTAAGDIDIENCLSLWYHAYTTAYKVYMKNVGTCDAVFLSNIATTSELNNVHVGMVKTQTAAATYSLTVQYCLGGTTITDCKFQRGCAPVANGHCAAFSYVIGATITNSSFGIIQYYRSSGCPFYFIQCADVKIDTCRSFNGYQIFLTGYNENFDITDFDCIDRYIGYSNANSATYDFYIGGGSKNILIDGVTWGFGGTVPNIMSPAGIATIISAIDITIRNIGSFASPIPVTTFRPNYYAPIVVWLQTNAEKNIKIQRVYLDGIRTGMATTRNSAYEVDAEHVYVGRLALTSSAAYLITNSSCDSHVKACGGGANTVTANLSVYGTHFFDMFLGDYTGRVWLNLHEPTTSTASQVTVTAGEAKFTSGGQLGLRALGDQVVIEDSLFRIGHTGFVNVAPTLTGTNTGNLTYEYDIDTGSGYGGSWKTLNGTNLSAEVIDPVVGFKLKYRLTCATAAITNALTYIRINTTSTPEAQAANLYPLDVAQASYTLTGLVDGTTVVIYDELYTEELARYTLTGETEYTYDYEWNSNDGDFYINILLWKDDKQLIKMTNVELSSADQSVPISQIDDLVYNVTITGTYNILSGTKQIEMDSSAEDWIVPEVYSTWKNWVLIDDSMKYDFAFRIVGGDEIDDPKYIPKYTYLINGWKGKPAEASYTLNVTDGILLVDGGGDPFVDTTGAYTVRVNYEQPVQAITVNTGGSTGPTPEEIAAAVWDALTASHVDAGSFGKKVGDLIVAPTAADVADAVWDEAISGHMTSGTTGAALEYAAGTAEDIATNVNSILVTVGSLPSASDNADAVWDEILTAAEHNIPTSAGRKLRQLASDVIIDGTAVSATSNTIVLDGDASAVDGAYDPGYIVICEGTGAGQTRIITEYVGATKTAVINRAWKTIPDITSKYVIMGYADMQSVNEGRIRAAGARTAQLNAFASSVDDTYVGQLMFLTSGTGEDQTAVVVSYDGATKMATLDRDWATIPDTTTNYVMLPASPVILARMEHVGAIIPKVKTVDVSLVNL